MSPSSPSDRESRHRSPFREAGEEEEALEGVVSHIFFANEESGWAAVRVDPDGGGLPVQAKGPMPGVSLGDPVRLAGRFVRDPRWGPQLQVTSYEPRIPTSEEGIRRYLGSGLVEGIGSGLAARLVDFFGSATLEVIEHQPERLKEVEGIGPKRARAIREALGQQREIKQVMVFLQGHGLSPGKAVAVYKRYGSGAVAQIRQNPFRLAEDVFGIGFATADRMAAALGIGPEAPFRIQAGLELTLSQAGEEGHLYLPEEELTLRAAALLDVDEALVSGEMPHMVESGRIRVEEVSGPSGAPVRACYRPGTLRAEVELAARLRALAAADAAASFAAASFAAASSAAASSAAASSATASIAAASRIPASSSRHPRLSPGATTPQALARATARIGITLASAQTKAVETALGSKVTVITGGPGTGKTTILRVLLQLAEDAGLTAELAAPTGRAAKRMHEATGRPARTLHRLLEFLPRAGGFQRTAERPLECDLLVVDETSMLDVFLARAMLRAVPDSAQLVLVGDVDQLPSVGPGAVLQQIIASGRVPVVRLTEVYRQAARSQIVVCAHQVNRGQVPTPPPSEGPGSAPGEVFVMHVEDATRAAELIERMVCHRIPQRYGLDPLEDIQVLSPTRRGQTGTERLNALLQNALNPSGEALERRGRILRVGDRVMQIRNDYDKEVWNGDQGRVVRFDPSPEGQPHKTRIQVAFDGRLVEYAEQELDQLLLSYACTVHKSQGSEFPAVLLPLFSEHYLMLQRNLLYTALTRARTLFVLLGSPRAIRRAVQNDQVRLRYTALAERIRDGERRGP